MVNGRLGGKIIKFAFPLVLTGMLQMLYNAADMVVVGQFSGHRALAAVSATAAFVALFVNFFSGLAVGTNAVLSQYIGSDSREDAFETVHTSVAMSLIFGVLLMISGFWFVRPVLSAMGTPDDVLPLAEIYLKIYFLGSPANLIYNFGSAVIRTTGDTKRPLYFLSVAGVINIILNLVLVICFKLDTAGVAIATVVSQYVSAALVMSALVRSDGFCKVVPRNIRIYPKKLARLLYIGLPASVQGVMFSVSNIIIQSSVNSFGSLAIAGSGASSDIENFVYLGMNSFSQAALVFAGQNLGAGKKDRVLKSTLICLGFSFCTWAVLSAVTMTFKHQLIGLFIPSTPKAMNFAVRRIRIIVYTYFIFGFSDTLTGAINGLGKSMHSAAICLLGICGLRLLWIFTVFKRVHTFECLFVSYPLSWFATLIAMSVCYVLVYRKIAERTVQ